MPWFAALAEAVVDAVAATEVGQVATTAMDVASVVSDPGKIAQGISKLKEGASAIGEAGTTGEKLSAASSLARPAALTAYRAHSVVGSADSLKDKITGHNSNSRSSDDDMSDALTHLSSDQGNIYQHRNDSEATLVEPSSPSASKNSSEYSPKAAQDPDIGDVNYQHGSGNMRV